MKNYLILSTDYINIDSQIKQILKDNKLSKDNITKYDLCNDSLDKVIEDLDTYSLLFDNKIVICENVYFLSSSKIKSNVVQDEELLEKYINNPNQNNMLILICDKLDERKKLCKLVREKFVVLDTNISIEDKIKENLEDYKMDYKTIKYLVECCNNNNERILNELEKLKCYKLNEKDITIQDIDDIVIKSLDDDVFCLINSIINKDKQKAFSIYSDLLLKGEEISKIVIMVADQFRLIYKTKVLINSSKTREEISSMFKIHPYRVKLAIQQSYDFTDTQLLGYLSELYEIDKKNKLGLNVENFAFENFLLNL